MPIVPAKCTECGGILQVDKEKDAAVCSHCNTPFIIEKAVNNYIGIAGRDDFEIIACELIKYNGAAVDVIIPDSVIHIGSKAFSGRAGLRSVVIPDRVTSIGNNVFAGCSGLTEITIPDSVTSIGIGAFSGCSRLTEITIPDGVTSVGAGTFSGCSGLTEITIPDSVTSIEPLAFQSCTNLVTVILMGNPEIKEDAFLDTYWHKQQIETEKELQRVRKLRHEQGVCIHCGGKLKMFSKTCKSCGRSDQNI